MQSTNIISRYKWQWSPYIQLELCKNCKSKNKTPWMTGVTFQNPHLSLNLFKDEGLVPCCFSMWYRLHRRDKCPMPNTSECVHPRPGHTTADATNHWLFLLGTAGQQGLPNIDRQKSAVTVSIYIYIVNALHKNLQFPFDKKYVNDVTVNHTY